MLVCLGGWLETGAPGGGKKGGLAAPTSPQGGHPHLSGPPLPLAKQLSQQHLPAHTHLGEALALPTTQGSWPLSRHAPFRSRQSMRCPRSVNSWENRGVCAEGRKAPSRARLDIDRGEGGGPIWLHRQCLGAGAAHRASQCGAFCTHRPNGAF